MGRRIVDLVGMRFGKLTVIEDSGERRNEEVFWTCICECGKVTGCRGSDLRDRKMISCGCLKEKKNVYDLSGEYGIGLTNNGQKYFYFDLEDYDLIKDYCWSNLSNSDNHINSCIDGVAVGLHRLIMGTQNSSDVVVDHKNRNPQDNRRENLRICTESENGRNKKIQKNNTSGIIGVRWVAKDSVYVARITVDNRMVHLGSFKNIDDAIRARLLGERDYYGEFAPQEHLFSQYGIDKPNDKKNGGEEWQM